MNFQYFFFNTYAGYFLQMVPFALGAGLLAAYLTGLDGVTLLLRVIGLMWYWLFYQHSGGRVWFFEWTYNFIPNFWHHFRGETLANALMFLPFGVLYPLAGEGRGFRRTMAAGAGLILAIELLQPVFGRAFDINDVILNLAGVAVSAGVFALIFRERHAAVPYRPRVNRIQTDPLLCGLSLHL